MMMILWWTLVVDVYLHLLHVVIYQNEELKGEILDDLPIHVTDWYPTLLSAGLESQTPNTFDGEDFWKFFENGEEERVDEVLADRIILLNADKYGCGTDVCGGILTGTNQLVSWESGEPEINTCGTIPDGAVSETCICSKKFCLFDLENDTCEYNNVYEDNVEIGDMLKKVLSDYYEEQSMVLFDSIFNVATVIAAKGTYDGYWEQWAAETYDCESWEDRS